MPNKIRISVITSLYRCSRFLPEFLRRFAMLSNLDECELVIVHNDPTEEELDILVNCVGDDISFVHIIVERESLYASWNRGIQRASGEFIAIWNVDDIRTIDSLASQKKALKASNADLCYGDFYGVSAYGRTEGHLYKYEGYELAKEEVFRRHIIGCFPMWRKTIHQRAGYFDEQFRLVGDFEFQMRAAFYCNFVKAEAELGYYLEQVDSKLSNNKLLQHSERTVIRLRYRVYDKLMLHFLPASLFFRLKKIRCFGKWIRLNSMDPALRKFGSGAFRSLLKMPFSYCLWFAQWSANTAGKLIKGKTLPS